MVFFESIASVKPCKTRLFLVAPWQKLGRILLLWIFTTFVIFASLSIFCESCNIMVSAVAQV